MPLQLPKTKTEQIELLRERIDQSGLSATRFALDVMIRDPRNVRRWLSGEQSIPQRVVEWLVRPWTSPWPPRGGVPQ